MNLTQLFFSQRNYPSAYKFPISKRKRRKFTATSKHSQEYITFSYCIILAGQMFRREHNKRSRKIFTWQAIHSLVTGSRKCPK